MINIGIVGLGKMGISHFAIVNAHPKLNLVAISDPAKAVSWGLKKYTGVNTYSTFEKMLQNEQLHAVLLSTPTKLHAQHIRLALDSNMHVFVEKPFCLDPIDSLAVTELSRAKNLVTQVGYHNRFIGTFIRANEILKSGVIGKPFHIQGESYGPVITKQQKKSWRSEKSNGGGCVYDYSSHVINLMEFFVGKSESVLNAVLQHIYSSGTEDAVFSNLLYSQNITGQLIVNWSDDTYRKMSTTVTILGDNGKIEVNAQQLRVYLKKDTKIDDTLQQGWNVSYLTDHSLPTDFYLRGEEYSAQIDSFVNAIEQHDVSNQNSFASALDTDNTIAEIFNVGTRVKTNG